MIEPLEFSHDGRCLVVKALLGHGRCKVRVYENDAAITRITYEVSYEDAVDAQEVTGIHSILMELMELAKRDVETGIVEIV